jgi:hypothetical protein
MWYRNLLVSASMALLLISGPVTATAADISFARYVVNLTGEIKAGDAERIADLVAQQRSVLRIFVNSPGGDLSEALRIKDLVNGLHLSVNVARSGKCVSACFFIFLEGHTRFATGANVVAKLKSPEEVDVVSGVVGIHRPYLKSPSGDIDGVKKQEALMRNAKDYLVSKMVPQYLIDEMMGRPSNDIYWLGERDLNLLNEFSAGDEEALISKCGYIRPDVRQAQRWSSEKWNKLWDCEFDYWDEQYRPLQVQYLAKLRTGWRPWSAK